MITKEQAKEIVAYRITTIVDTVAGMKKKDILPVPTKKILIKEIAKEWFATGKEEDMLVKGYEWTLSDSYVHNKWDTIQVELKKQGIYLAGKIFEGDWKFCDEKEFKKRKKLNESDINTREEKHNIDIKLANAKWKNFNMPLASPIKQLN